MNYMEWVFNVINNTCAFYAVTSQNVFCEKKQILLNDPTRSQNSTVGKSMSLWFSLCKFVAKAFLVCKQLWIMFLSSAFETKETCSRVTERNTRICLVVISRISLFSVIFSHSLAVVFLFFICFEHQGALLDLVLIYFSQICRDQSQDSFSRNKNIRFSCSYISCFSVRADQWYQLFQCYSCARTNHNICI